MLSFRVLVTLSKSKIYDIDIVLCVLTTSYQEIIWLDVTMDDPLFVYLLDSLNHLIGNMQNSFQVKFAPAFLKQVL